MTSILLTPTFLLITSIIIHVSLSKECTCGLETIQPRIINGRIATSGRFPWVVYVMNLDLMKGCTGTIISERHVLTAAHCLTEKQDTRKLFVFLDQGCDRESLFAGRQLRVRKSYRHSDYRSQTGGNDVGILHLDRPLSFNQSFMPICLMSDPDAGIRFRSNRRNDDVPFDNLVVSGWGFTNRGRHLIDNGCLNEVDLAPVSDKECSRYYNDINSQLTFCAGGKGNICNGDSGGPLMTRRNGLVYLAGITSFGRTDCGVATRQPAGFERIPPHYDWISRRAIFGHLCFK